MLSNSSSQVFHFPIEIENAIFDDLGGFYKPNFEKVQQNLNSNEDDLRAYLGTYFPRSFAEAYKIFEDLFHNKDIKNNFKKKNELFILDIGSGTGGNILGLLWIMKSSFKNFRHKKIYILSIDGNDKALKIQKRLIKKFFPTNIIIDSKKITISRDNIAKKLKNVLIKNKFDIIMSFKFVNEFYREEFLFNWNEIPGNESDRLIEFLQKNFGFTWVSEAEIKKIDSDGTISVYNDTSSILLKLNTDENKVILINKRKIEDEFIVKMDNGKLKIFREKYTKNKGMYRIITETVSRYLNENGLFVLSDVTDPTNTNLFLPHIMNKEISDYLKSSPDLRPILPLSCAFWHKNCRAKRCFTRRDFLFRFNDGSNVHHKSIHNSGISYKVLVHKNTAKRILRHIEKQDCYIISKGQTCTKGYYNCRDINSDEHVDAFSFGTIE